MSALQRYRHTGLLPHVPRARHARVGWETWRSGSGVRGGQRVRQARSRRPAAMSAQQWRFGNHVRPRRSPPALYQVLNTTARLEMNESGGWKCQWWYGGARVGPARSAMAAELAVAGVAEVQMVIESREKARMLISRPRPWKAFCK